MALTTRSRSKIDSHFISRLPKCELHLHIEGTLEPEMMFALAERNKVKLPFRNVAAVRKAYNFSNLQDFLDIYYAGASVLKTEQDFYDLAYAYYTKAAEQHIRHAEVFFDPQTHTDRGIPYGVVIDGLTQARDDAKKNLKVSSYLIMCFLRHLTEDAAIKTLKQAIPHKRKIIGVGLDSSEKGHPPEKFKKVYAMARRHKLLCVAHAGEEGTADYVWGALRDLKVKRVDHGIRSLDDPNLVKHLASKKIPLTVCPLSNVKLRVFKDMKQHTLKIMLEKGLHATVNSDDPAYFGGYVNENFLAAHKALGLTRKELVQLARNSFEASFLPKARKAALLREVKKYAEQFEE